MVLRQLHIILVTATAVAVVCSCNQKTARMGAATAVAPPTPEPDLAPNAPQDEQMPAPPNTDDAVVPGGPPTDGEKVGNLALIPGELYLRVGTSAEIQVLETSKEHAVAKSAAEKVELIVEPADMAIVTLDRSVNPPVYRVTGKSAGAVPGKILVKGRPDVSSIIHVSACPTAPVVGIWIDADGSGIAKAENFLGDVVAYSGTLSGSVNYGYKSASAHPINGPAPAGFEWKVFFYQGSDGLSLSFYSGVDEGGTTGNSVDVDIVTSGNNMADSVLLSDDGVELKQGQDAGDALKRYSGRFRYGSNTDGGVIGPFTGKSYKIGVNVLKSGDVRKTTFYSGDGGSFPLEAPGRAAASFIVANRDKPQC